MTGRGEEVEGKIELIEAEEFDIKEFSVSFIDQPSDKFLSRVLFSSLMLSVDRNQLCAKKANIKRARQSILQFSHCRMIFLVQSF